LLLGGAGLASADWLVTTDGELIETRGEWRVEGSRVVFAAANGTLTAVRASSIDFPATEAYAAELATPAEPAAPAVPAEPVLVLTDRDLPRVRTAEPLETSQPGADETEARPDADDDPDSTTAVDAEGSGGDENGESTSDESSSEEAASATRDPAAEAENADADAAPTAKPAAPPVKPSPGTQPLPAEVTVTSWQEQSLDTGIRFIGTLANDSKAFATQLRVEAAIYDEAGRLIETKRASLARTSISPGRSTTFEVSFPQVFTYGEVRFTPGGRSLQGRDESAANASVTTAAEPPLR
jgi:hypothetical protein